MVLKSLLKRISKNDGEASAFSWTHLGDLSVSEGSVWIGDFYMANPEDGCTVDLENGSYSVFVQESGGLLSKLVHAVELRASGQADFEIGAKIGEFSVDRATAGICDMTALDAAIGERDDDFQDLIEDEVLSEAGELEFELAGAGQIYYSETGEGDGSFPVHELKTDGARAGFRAIFIEQSEL